MRHKRFLFYTISVFSIFILLVAFSANAQTHDTIQLYKSTEFTSPNSFTHGVEGPAVDRSGNVYAVNFAHEGTIGIVSPEGNPGLFITLPDSSVGNGIRFNRKGDMLIADYTKHNVLRVNMKTKEISVFAHEPKMTQPNDIAIDSRERVYASDPNFKLNTGRIWGVDRHGNVALLDTLNGPANGIEVSPDEKKLYVNAGRKVWSYDLSAKGKLSNRSLLIEFTDFGCDGMRCDADGDLYIARIGKGVIAKVSPNGEVLKEITLIGKKPTNVAFGGNDGCTVYVTLMDMGNLESFRVDTPGREWKMHKR